MKEKAKSRYVKAIGAIIGIFALILLICFVSIYVYAKTNIDFDADVRLFSDSRSTEGTRFYANRGDIPVELEMAGTLKKIHYSLEDISPYIIKGYLAVEDRHFYQHRGIDWKRTASAAINYIFGSGTRFGGSTITQQVVKNISGDNQLTLKRKLDEIIRAMHIEQNYSKDDILELYLNIVPMSDNMYGVGIASESYFGKEPFMLSAAEAATLIGISNAPSAYSPYINPDKCLEKRNNVLSVMHREGVITDEEYETAYNTPLTVLPRGEGGDIYDSWFVETVIKEASRDLALKMNISKTAAEHILLGGGYKIYTTADIDVQKILEEYFENTDNFPYEVNCGLGYAMVITDSETGDLVATVGGVGEKRANRILNRAIVPHTPGSVLKPIALYAPLIDEGKIGWATVFDDVPVSFTETDEGYTPYPKNSPNVYDGLINVNNALRLSKNTVAIRLCKMRGERAVFNTLKYDYGFDTLAEMEKTADGGTITDIAISPMALGQLSYGVSVAKITEAYSTLSDGVHKKMRSYLHVIDSEGNVILENKKEEKEILKPTTARIMTKILEGVVESGTARSVTLGDIVPTAGKTGTSGGSKDKMFVGYTPYYTAGIWCGYDKGDMSLTAVSPSHLEIWDDIMHMVHEKKLGAKASEQFSTEGLIYRPYCMDSGDLYSETCALDVRGSRIAYGYFTPDTAPDRICGRHIACYYDSIEKGIASSYCPMKNLVMISLLDIPGRVFPCEVNVKDAEYVYRDIGDFYRLPDTEYIPYFYYALPPGEYAGISGGKRQFNCACPKHS